MGIGKGNTRQAAGAVLRVTVSSGYFSKVPSAAWLVV